MQQHGGNITAFAKEIGCDPLEVIDLSSNINFGRPTLDIDFNSLDISAYPNYDELYTAIASLYNVSSTNIELYNGATSAIHTLFRELSLKHVTLYAPLYGEYQHAALSHGYEIEIINRLDQMDHEIQENSLVVFVNPSTPDGRFYALDKLMHRWIEKNATILIDESFLDFTIFASTTKYLNYDKLYILKSMTKFYSSAGIRIGALLSNEENIAQLKQKEPLWKISEFDSQYLQSALRDINFPHTARAINQKHRKELITLLEQSTVIQKVYPSTANFVLVKLFNIKAAAFQEALKPYKIMVRNCANFQGLDDSFVRIAVKNKNALNRLKEALCKISI